MIKGVRLAGQVGLRPGRSRGKGKARSVIRGMGVGRMILGRMIVFL